MIRLSIEPMKRDGADKMAKALERFRREDPTFRVITDEETGQTLIAGMGQLHLEIYVERIRREYKVECLIGEPRWPIAKRRLKGNRVQLQAQETNRRFGTIRSRRRALEPLPEDSPIPYEFVDEVSQGGFRRNTSRRR